MNTIIKDDNYSNLTHKKYLESIDIVQRSIEKFAENNKIYTKYMKDKDIKPALTKLRNALTQRDFRVDKVDYSNGWRYQGGYNKMYALQEMVKDDLYYSVFKFAVENNKGKQLMVSDVRRNINSLYKLLTINYETANYEKF